MKNYPESISLDMGYCRERQRTLLGVLERLKADRVVVTRAEHVQYLTGFRPHRLMCAAVSLDSDGHCLLVAPNAPPDAVAADAVVTFQAQWHATLRQEQPFAAAEVLGQALRDRPAARRLAVECSWFGSHLRDAMIGTSDVELVDIEPGLWQLRRRKYPDELRMIARTEACTEAMYARAREIIRPGITELEVFCELHAAGVAAAGEPLTDLGNDFQCNSPGGPPRPRAAQAGELFIIDLGPAYRGYYADNCRTFAVGGKPSDEQHNAWEQIVAVLDMTERTVRPGVKCRSVFEQAQQMLDCYCLRSFCHHLGHGFGLFPHEAPHLNPHWDDTFEEGDTFTAEPGLYGPQLKTGIRLEQNYLVTATGVERLLSFSLDL
jgi:Xaa-Pro aminopeptidase